MTQTDRRLPTHTLPTHTHARSLVHGAHFSQRTLPLVRESRCVESASKGESTQIGQWAVGVSSVMGCVASCLRASGAAVESRWAWMRTLSSVYSGP